MEKDEVRQDPKVEETEKDIESLLKLTILRFQKEERESGSEGCEVLKTKQNANRKFKIKSCFRRRLGGCCFG